MQIVYKSSKTQGVRKKIHVVIDEINSTHQFIYIQLHYQILRSTITH